MREGELKGIEQGHAQGIEQGIEAGIRQSIEALVELARERIKRIQDQGMLRQVLVAMSAASTARKARRYLLALNKSEEE